MRKKKAMKKTLLFAIISTLLIGIVGCASNSDAAGQALSGVLMGIGQGLSGLQKFALSGMKLMEEPESAILISATDEELCAFFIEVASRLRRIVEQMPDGNPTAESLNMLWAYAATHGRLDDLANALLGFDAGHNAVDGNAPSESKRTFRK